MKEKTPSINLGVNLSEILMKTRKTRNRISRFMERLTVDSNFPEKNNSQILISHVATRFRQWATQRLKAGDAWRQE